MFEGRVSQQTVHVIRRRPTCNSVLMVNERRPILKKLDLGPHAARRMKIDFKCCVKGRLVIVKRQKNERPSKLLTDSKASKKRHDFDGSTYTSVKRVVGFCRSCNRHSFDG